MTGVRWGFRTTTGRFYCKLFMVLDPNEQQEFRSWSSCNVKSLKGKVQHFKEVFKHDEIVAIQETHLKKWQEGRLPARLGFDGAVCSSYGAQARGTALLWKKPWKVHEECKVIDEEGRFAGAVLVKGDIKHIVVSLYAPNVDRTRRTREDYVSWLISVRHRISLLQVKASKAVKT